MTGFIVFAHGSRIETANDAVRAVAAQMAVRMRMAGDHPVAAAFLECGQPDLLGAVDALASMGVSRVIVIPYFLTLGTHLQRDLPELARRASELHPAVAIEVTPPLDGHSGLLQAVLDRASAAEAAQPDKNRGAA